MITLIGIPTHTLCFLEHRCLLFQLPQDSVKPEGIQMIDAFELESFLLIFLAFHLSIFNINFIYHCLLHHYCHGIDTNSVFIKGFIMNSMLLIYVNVRSLFCASFT